MHILETAQEMYRCVMVVSYINSHQLLCWMCAFTDKGEHRKMVSVFSFH